MSCAISVTLSVYRPVFPPPGLSVYSVEKAGASSSSPSSSLNWFEVSYVNVPCERSTSIGNMLAPFITL